MYVHVALVFMGWAIHSLKRDLPFIGSQRNLFHVIWLHKTWLELILF